MRPITNILLVLALICYVFLAFYDITIHGTVTGLEFTAGTISQALSLSHVIVALLPFLACFGAVTLNCLKSRWWILGAIAFILIWLWFYMYTNSFHDIVLQHSPEVTPDNDMGEGFQIQELGIGFKLSFVLTALSLVSAIMSLLPFKFNETIEKAVDDTFEDGRRHVREEFNRLEATFTSPTRTSTTNPPLRHQPNNNPPPPSRTKKIPLASCQNNKE